MEKRLEFSDQVCLILHRARGLRNALGDASIRSAHVLMCISNKPPTLAGYILNDFRISIDELRASLEAAIKAGAEGSPSDSLDAITDRARLWAVRVGCHFVDTEHVLLAALESGDPSIRRALAVLGVSLEAVLARAEAIADDVAKGRAIPDQRARKSK